MATSDVTIPENGGQEAGKLHPHVLAVLRWCISCVWTAASELLQKLLAAPYRPSIQAAKPRINDTRMIHKKSVRTKTPQRQKSTEHISPVPKVDCEVLHSPQDAHNLDIIFVHGLYGSLANTWRQGDWKQKYKWGPNRVPIKRATSIPSACDKCDHGIKAPDIQINIKNYDFCLCDYHQKYNVDENSDLAKDNEKSDTKKDYDNKKYEYNVSNKDCCDCHSKSDLNTKQNKTKNDQVFTSLTESIYNNDFMESVEIVDNYEAQANFVRDLFRKQNCDNLCDIDSDLEKRECNCKGKRSDSEGESKIEDSMRKCPIGCGCVCEKCYSPCWPKDWLQIDYPDARVISINYTSDPYLWRPIWIKESKRLRLHERAEQMTSQLLDLGVGERPVIWVGHSKGGLFIKQIYAQAYEAHLRLTKSEENKQTDIQMETQVTDAFTDIDKIKTDNDLQEKIVQFVENFEIESKIEADNIEKSIEETNVLINNLHYILDNSEFKKVDEAVDVKLIDDDKRASLWYNSGGFMFYSVPHRGSSLADIVLAPLMMRSVELLEISKDCSLVLELQDRWLKATQSSQPMVRSLVETCRTLMAVLWLRIVSVESADAGIGALCGVSVDHREICKPSSRSCLLYTELLNLIHATLDKCR